MKKIIYSTAIFSVLFFLFLDPAEAVNASKSGVLLWFNTILPTLLPFMILSNLILSLDLIAYITFFLAPLFCPLFGITRDGCYALVIGFLCGYPMGAKITADLTASGRISREEGQYLLGFCNNASPSFLITFVVIQALAKPDLLLPTLGIVYGAPITYALLSQIFYRKKIRAAGIRTAPAVKSPVTISFSLVDQSIMNGFENITKLGGYIILFSLIAAMLRHLPVKNELPHLILTGITEITNGIQAVSSSTLPFTGKFLLLLPLITFGGLSSTAQTESMIKQSRLSLSKYITAKFLTMLLAVLYTVVFLTAAM